MVTAYSWDANGNNTLVQAGASVTTYTWDGENRLTKLALARGRRTWPSPCESLGILTLNLALFAAFIFLMYQYIVPPRTHLGWVDGERRKIQPLPPAVVAGAEDLSREISAAFEAFRDPGKLDAQGFLDAVKAKDAAKIEALRDGVAESWRINQDALAVMHEVAQRANACRLTPERIRAD
jgi:YD repeat-containing protein